MASTVSGVLLTGVHGSRPSSGVTAGTLYSCTTHSLVYQTSDTGSTWATWATLTGTGLTDPMTTRGDIIVRDSSNVTARKAIGSAGKILSSDGTDVSWGNGPMTTAGDIIIGGASGLPTRLAAGATSGHVLTSNGSGAAPSYQAASAGGVTIQYPPLKPGTPTYDFATASLPGAFTAHSSQGSWATSNCLTQGEAWAGSSLDMNFSAQMGALHVTHSDTDFDFSVGGIRRAGFATSTTPQYMFGVAALNSAGTGVGVTVYNDGACYLATITTWGYAANSDSWANHGSLSQTGDWWLRLKRVSGTWTGYASQSGAAWDKTFSTRADSIVVDRLVFGLLFDPGAATYYGRLSADYMDVAV